MLIYSCNDGNHPTNFAPFVDSLPTKSNPSLHADGAFLSKRCSKCKINKTLNQFAKLARLKDGHASWCHQCRYSYNKHWRTKYRERCRKTQKKWRHRNLEKLRKTGKYRNNKKRSTLKGNLDCKMGNRLRDSLKRSKTGRHWETLVGYTISNLRKHLESLFTKGMSWDLFMQGKIHIDHIIPISKFHYEKPEDLEFKICWKLANLQPLWAKDNLSKSNKTKEEWRKHE